jgi:hypothetical protein
VRSAELDEEVMAFLAERARKTAGEFGKDYRELPLLEWGDSIQYQAITPDGRPRILVVRDGTDWWRIRYQIAHEVFHWLCSPPQTFHWTHEMLAVETAVRAMDEIGEHEYAQRARDLLTEQAPLLSVEEMLATPLAQGYPAGLYGRAWVTGRQLTEAVGWERVKQLASSFGADGKVDLLAWVRSVPGAERPLIEAVLGTPWPAWV